MKLLRGALLAFGMVAFAAFGLAADKDKAKKDKEFGADYKIPLIAPEIRAKLTFTDDQKKSIDALCKEFDQKNTDAIATAKDAVTKAKDDLKQAQKDKDKAAIKTAQTTIKDATATLDKLRKEYETKMFGMFTAEQKKAYDDAKTGN